MYLAWAKSVGWFMNHLAICFHLSAERLNHQSSINCNTFIVLPSAD